MAFTIDDDEYALPELDARTWLEALVLEPPGCWWQLVPARLAGDGADRIARRLFDDGDPFDLDDLEDVAIQVLTAAIGVDLWAACRLARMAWGNWIAFDGWSYTHGIDPLTEPAPRLLNAVYAWRLAGCEKQRDVARLNDEVFVPAPARTASGRARDAAPPTWNDEAEAASFEHAMSALTGGTGRARRNG